MGPSVISLVALLLIPLLVQSSPVPSEDLHHLDPKTRNFSHAPHVLPLKGIASRRRHPSIRSRTAALIDPEHERNFLVQVSLGGQTVDLEVDTGSSNTWAITAGYVCEAGSECAYGTAINVDDAFEIIEGETFTTSYVDGSGGSGLLANTSVVVDGIMISEQSIGLVNLLHAPGDGPISGFIGMAYPSLASVQSGSATVTYSSILNTIFTEGLANPLFSMAISRDTSQSGFGGYLTIGGVPDISDAYINASPIYGSAPIEVNPLYNVGDIFSDYAITVDAVSWSDSSGDAAAVNSAPFIFIVDSGTTLSQFPTDTAAAINALFQPPASLNSIGLYEVLCTAIAPQLSITVGGVSLPINPIDLILSGDGPCYTGVQPTSNPAGILGDSMMRSLLAVFDWGEKMVHLASRPDYKS